MIFRCKNCGGNVVYSPEKKSMLCPFCDGEHSEERQDYRNFDMKMCPNCNGEVPVFEHTSATQCPYCDSYLILNERVEGEYTPKMVIPFKFGKEACKKAIRDKFSKCLFAPTDFLSEVRLNGVQGNYVPYWFFDYDTQCHFQGEGTKTRTWRTGNLQYTETSYYAIRRSLNIDFRKIPVDASVQMPDDVMDLMEPFDYAQLEEFKPEYMSGFYGEKYNMTSDLVESRAVKKRDDDVNDMIKGTYSGYGTVKTVSKNVNVGRSEVIYGLLPVWKYTYTYKDKTYPFYVNGQTGKIVGTAPVSAKKVWAYAGTLWACLTLILAFANGIMGYL